MSFSHRNTTKHPATWLPLNSKTGSKTTDYLFKLKSVGFDSDSYDLSMIMYLIWVLEKNTKQSLKVYRNPGAWPYFEVKLK